MYIAAPSSKPQTIEGIELLGHLCDVISTLSLHILLCGHGPFFGQTQTLQPRAPARLRFGDRVGRAIVVIFHIPVSHPGAQPAP
jgi:hypothetical protein